MDFYFAITNSMIEKYGMPENIDGTYNWKLSNDFLYYVLADSSGKLLDLINRYQKEYWAKVPFTICKGSIDNGDAIEVLRACMVGDSMRSLNVIVSEMT